MINTKYKSFNIYMISFFYLEQITSKPELNTTCCNYYSYKILSATGYVY